MNGLSHPNIAAYQHAPDAHFSGRAETVRLADRRNAVFTGTRSSQGPALGPGGTLSPVRACLCVLCCMHKPVPQGFFACGWPRLSLIRSNPSRTRSSRRFAAALACGLPKLQQVLPRCLTRLISLPWMVQAREFLGIESLHEGWASTKSGSHISHVSPRVAIPCDLISCFGDFSLG